MSVWEIFLLVKGIFLTGIIIVLLYQIAGLTKDMWENRPRKRK